MGRVIFVSKFGNERGQTLFAAHLSTVLAENHKTAIVDFEPSNHLLENFIAKRHHFNLKNNQNLPVATYFSYRKNLIGEISAQFDYVVLDAKNIAFAAVSDVLLTLVGDKTIVQSLTTQNSQISGNIWNAKKAVAAKGKNAFKHVIVPLQSLCADEIESLKKASKMTGYKIAPVLKQNEAYGSGIENGVTVLDKNLPFFKNSFGEEDFFARRNLKEIFQFVLSV